MKHPAIGKIRTRAERDLTWRSIVPLQLILRICSAVYMNPRKRAEEAFPLPWSQVAIWCALKDDKAAYRAINELLDKNYLKCDGLRGCPPINHYFLVLNYPSKGAIDSGSKGAIVTPSKGAIDSGSKGAHHISNSFQEERLEERAGIGSLRSEGTKGDGLALPPAAKEGTTTDAIGEKIASGLKQFRSTLAKTPVANVQPAARPAPARKTPLKGKHK